MAPKLVATGLYNLQRSCTAGGLPSLFIRAPDDAHKRQVRSGLACDKGREGIGHVQEDVGVAAVVANNASWTRPGVASWKCHPFYLDESKTKQYRTAGELPRRHSERRSLWWGQRGRGLTYQPVQDQDQERSQCPKR